MMIALKNSSACVLTRKTLRKAHMINKSQLVNRQ